MADRAISVAAGVGLLAAQHPRRPAAGSPACGRSSLPSAIAVTGYFPGRRLRILGDLPRQRHAPVGAMVHAPGLPARRAARRCARIRRGGRPHGVDLVHRRRADVGDQHQHARRSVHRRSTRRACATHRNSSASIAWVTSDSSGTTRSTCGTSWSCHIWLSSAAPEAEGGLAPTRGGGHPRTSDRETRRSSPGDGRTTHCRGTL